MNPRRFLRAVRGERPGEAPRFRRRWGTVTAVSGTTVTVSVGGGTAISGVRRFAHYTPTVGDHVAIDFNGSDPVVVGKLA